MIQQFDLKDFKGHEDYTQFRMPGLTIIAGINNSGKSSLLQAIYLLTQNRSINFPQLSLQDPLGLGSFKDVLNKEKNREESLEFGIEFDQEFLLHDQFEQVSVQFVYRDVAMFDIQSVAMNTQGNPILDEIEVHYKKVEEEERTINLKFHSLDSEAFYRISGDVDQGFCKMKGAIPDLIVYRDLADRKSRALPSHDFEKITEYLSMLNTDNIKYLKALRYDYIRESAYSSGVSNDLGLSGENTAEIIATRWDHLTDIEEEGSRVAFSTLFDRWVSKLLGDRYRIRSMPVEKGKYDLVVEESGMRLSIDQVGFGISQLLPVLTRILTSKRNDILLIENPEVHLHPKLQAQFVDLYLFAMQNGRKVLVETQSEHIVNRIRLRIKAASELLDRINIYFFEKTDGVIRHTEIEITPEGKLAFWPKNFFDQSYNDLLGLISDEDLL